MDSLIHITKTKEAVIKYVRSTKSNMIIKLLLIVAICLLVLRIAIDIGFNLKSILLLLLASLICIVMFLTSYYDSVYDYADLELWFYTDKLVIHRPKRYYDRRVTRLEYNTMYYNEISCCEYRKQMKCLYFRGNVHARWYNYLKDDTVPDKPTRDMYVKNTMQYSNRAGLDDIDFLISEIETYSPLRVEFDPVWN